MRPLGPDNVLVLAPGVLSGTTAPTSGRISVGCKSPLTGGIKEANAGGNPAQHLMKLGFRAIVVKGQPADTNKRYGLEVDENGARIVAADDYKGLWNYACCEKLLANYSKNASAISIAPPASCSSRVLRSRAPTRTRSAGLRATPRAGRRRRDGQQVPQVGGGRARQGQGPPGCRFEGLQRPQQEVFEGLPRRPQMFKTGTSSVVPVANMLNTFVYKNRTEGQSPDVNNLDGARIVESFETNGGGMHNCMTGCIVSCSNIVHDADGNYKTSALEFETLTLLGASCAIDSWDKVAELDRLCDEVGLDTIETGAAIAILMDSGGMEWGDAQGAAALIKEIAEGTELGKAIGNGAVATGKHRKHARVPHARGQAIPAWDPRPLKATGITYAAGPQGADHTAGLIVNPGLVDPTEQAQASQECQIVNAVCDSSGFCQFLGPNLDDIRTYYGLMYGEEISREQIADQGWEILRDEWAFNAAAGWKDEDNGLSDCLVNEGIGPDHSLKFDVDLETINRSKQRFDPREELFTAKATG